MILSLIVSLIPEIYPYFTEALCHIFFQKSRQFSDLGGFGLASGLYLAA